jgi:hypothetical protein
MARSGSALPGVLAILMGIWTGCGGCVYATSALGSRAEPVDTPFLNGAQNQAVQDLVVAAAVYDPVNAALSALSALVGPLLIVAGMFLLAQVPNSGLVGRVAFGASIVADALQALWAMVWFFLVRGPMADYVEAFARGMENRPAGMLDSLDAFTGTAIVVTAFIGLLYFAVKIALAALGLWRSGLVDALPADEPPPVDPDLGWAD